MDSLIHYRIVGYACTLMLHCTNGLVMLYNLYTDKRVMVDQQLQDLKTMQFQYLTVWNILFQIAYAVLGLSIDVLALTKRDHLLPKYVKKMRDTFFETVVAPGTLTVFTVFWPFFLYDREIIFPAFIDKVFSFKSNLIMHLGIVPIILWEMAFQPRMMPKSHIKNFVLVACYYLSYKARIVYVYLQKGLWPYPILHMTQGTIYFYLLHLYLISVVFCAYYLQWGVINAFWGSKSVKNKSK